MGGGLGGGSSNAATTLVALNRLWDLKIPVDILIGAQLFYGSADERLERLVYGRFHAVAANEVDLHLRNHKV